MVRRNKLKSENHWFLYIYINFFLIVYSILLYLSFALQITVLQTNSLSSFLNERTFSMIEVNSWESMHRCIHHTSWIRTLCYNRGFIYQYCRKWNNFKIFVNATVNGRINDVESKKTACWIVLNWYSIENKESYIGWSEIRKNSLASAICSQPEVSPVFRQKVIPTSTQTILFNQNYFTMNREGVISLNKSAANTW